MQAIGIIIPTYRPTITLVDVLKQIAQVLHNKKYFIYIVDDSAREQAHDFIKKHCLTLNLPIIHIQLKQNSGQQNAVLCGIKEALQQCNTFVTMDDDGQHSIDVLLPLLNALPANNAIAYAVSNVNDNAFRALGSRCRDYLFSFIIGVKGGVRVSSYRAFTHDIAQKISAWQGSFFYFSAAAVRLCPHCQMLNLQSGRHKRQEGKSGYTFIKLLCLYLKLVWHYGVCKKQAQIKQPYEIERITHTF